MASAALREHFVRLGEGGRWPNPQRFLGAAPFPEWQAWRFASIVRLGEGGQWPNPQRFLEAAPVLEWQALHVLRILDAKGGRLAAESAKVLGGRPFSGVAGVAPR